MQTVTILSVQPVATGGKVLPESEGFVVAIQNKVISTIIYQKHIHHVLVEDRCRLCGDPNESIEHIIDVCIKLLCS